eukprot:2945817-Rhodomonas_salina.1
MPLPGGSMVMADRTSIRSGLYTTLQNTRRRAPRSAHACSKQKRAADIGMWCCSSSDRAELLFETAGTIS